VALIRQYDPWRAFTSRIVPFAGHGWRAVGNQLCRYRRLEPKPTRAQTLLLFSDDNHLDLLRENLWTVANTWSELPRVCVVGDLGASEQVFREALGWWSQPWDFIPYPEIEAAFVQEQRDWLVKFGRHHIFGRKLAAVLYSARISPTLYCDSDVLWLSAPRFLDTVDLKGPFFFASTDSHASYCHAMLDTGCQDLMHPPYACAGLVYLYQWAWPEDVLEEWVVRALSIPPHGFAEQTIIAFLARRYGGYISGSEIAAFFDDWFRVFPASCRPSWSARHYISPVRHHFHRDAVLMRCGIMKRGADK
jgi:hypothetical protein